MLVLGLLQGQLEAQKLHFGSWHVQLLTLVQVAVATNTPFSRLFAPTPIAGLRVWWCSARQPCDRLTDLHMIGRPGLV